jgi:hypothetical protein
VSGEGLLNPQKMGVEAMMKRMVFWLGLFFLFNGALWASNTGSISGLVTDPSGAVIPGVTVKAVNTSTGIERSTTTNPNGFFAFPELPVGTYDISFRKEGFKELRQTGLVVDVTAPVRLDQTLQVGGVTQEVTVSSSAVLVDTQRTEMGEVIAGTHMTSMPLNGRGFTDLMALQPGVVPTSSGEYGSTAPSPSGELNPGLLSVSGQREDANGFMVNGGNVEEGGSNGAAVIPNLDSIAEFRIQTANFDAEYGNYSGGLVNVVTKSGTNQLHGAVFEFLRNNKMDARNFYSYDRTNPVTGAEIPGSARAELHRNQFGGTFGGPIIHDKVFFFGDYQGTRQVQGQNDLVLVPSAADRTGNLADRSSSMTGTVSGPYFANLLNTELGYPAGTVTVGEPYYTSGCKSSSQGVFPNAVIPPSAISAPAQALLSGGYLPTANVGPFYATSAYKGTIRDDKWGSRIDASTRLGMLSGYYFFDDFSTLNPFLSGNIPGFPGVQPGRAQQINFGDTKSFGPANVNELRLNFTRYAFWTGEPLGGLGKTLSSFGITGVYPVNPHAQGVPSVGTNEWSLGVDPFYEKQVNNTYQIIDNFVKVHGTHTTKFGGEFHTAQINLFDFGALNGTWGFNGAETGWDFADFLLGAVNSYNQGEQLPEYTRTHYYALFAQDSWRSKPSLTLNYGLRWEVSTPWYETHNELETLVYGVQSVAFPGAPKGWLIPTDPTVPHSVSRIRYNNFGVIIWIGWSPKAKGGISRRLFGGSGKSSIRASFGMFYTAFEDATSFNAVGDAPFGYYYVNPEKTLFANPFVNLPDGHDNGQRFPSPVPPLNVSASHPDAALTAADWASLFEPIASSPGFDHTNRIPYAEHYIFSFERQLTSNTLVNLSYVGTQGHRLLADQEANPGNAALCLSLSQPSEVLPGTAPCGPTGESGVYYPVTGGTINSACPNGPACINSTRGPFGPAFGSDGLFSTMANSRYNALEASVRHTSNRATLLIGYTYSKAMDNSSSWGPGAGSGGVEIINPINPKLGKSLSAFDVTHNFVASFVYELPFDKFLRANRATRGWKISGITRFATGLPVFITEQDDRSLLGTGGTGPTGSGIDAPNFTPGPLKISDPRKQNLSATPLLNPYFNTALFSQEPLGHLGTANRRFFHGPGINNWDLGLFKELKLTESKSLEIRAEFFSVFNHAQFNSGNGAANPDGNFINSTFGFVTSASGERIGQVAMKFYF